MPFAEFSRRQEFERSEHRREWHRQWRVKNPDKLAAARKRSYAKNRETKNTRRRDKRQTPAGWLQSILWQVRARCKRDGFVFDLKVGDVHLAVTCPITKRAIKYGCGTSDRDGPSLDRAVPSRGYVAGNVHVISRGANMIKQDCTDPDVFRALADYCEANCV